MPNKKFIRTIEDFVCGHCGQAVKGNGYTNHCPNCLWSKHVDNYPGDRLANCHGLMEPIGLLVKGKEQVIVHRCVICHKIIKNKVAKGDNQSAMIDISKKILPNFS